MEYNPSQIEKKWQEYWKKNNSFEPEDTKDKPKKYILSMFPYPSGRIHMGHVRNYCIGDAIARYYKKENFNTLHPIGWDSFGMPAENAAIKHNLHPKKWTYENIEYMRGELDSLGLSFSKNREFATSDEDYTKFEQEFIIKMFENGLLYQKDQDVNWCESCHTVLANEQVIEGCCWRCDNEIVIKQMPGYYIKITKYADELLNDLKKLENAWPKQVLTMQENWIGKSEGLEFELNLDEKSCNKLNNKFKSFSVFTTRADTIYGVTYAALAPKHPIVNELIKSKLLTKNQIDKITKMQNMSERESALHDKEGLYLGIDAIHPLTKEKIPIWVANFVLISYGKGAVMSVPAHDERDFEFATKYNLPIKTVIKDDILVDSERFSNLPANKAKSEIIKYFEDLKIGRRKINYKLRDWGISRQRYWGAPLPFIRCKKCGIVPQKIENLPITLPDDVVISGSGNPLQNHKSWQEDICPKCNNRALKESDTMDTFVQSSWYFLRYCSDRSNWKQKAFLKEDVDYWMSVDHYIGGIEHAILHLLYARFFTKVLRDLDFIDIDEPFSTLLTQGMVLKDGSKMSKSKGNTVDPDFIIKKYGADTARLFILFAAPPQKELEWNDNALEGAFRFIKRLYARSNHVEPTDTLVTIPHDSLNESEKFARRKVYEALKKSNEIYSGSFAFNTLIAASMEALNALSSQDNKDVYSEGYFILLNILEPIIPHVCWELSDRLFNRKNFSKIDIKEEVFVQDSITLAVTINGEKRGEIKVSKNLSKEDIFKEAKKECAKWFEDKKIVKEIFVPNKLVNFVLK